MSDVTRDISFPTARAGFRLPPAGLIALLSALAFIVVALSTGESSQLSANGIGGLLHGDHEAPAQEPPH